MFIQVVKGWAVGITILFVPVIILEVALSPEVPILMLLAIPVVPIIGALQGVLIGAIVCLGLKALPRRYK